MPFTAGGPRVGGDDLGFDFGNVMVLLKQSVCILFYQAMKEESPPKIVLHLHLLYYLNLVIII